MSTYEKLTKQIEDLTKQNKGFQQQLDTAIVPKYQIGQTVWWIGCGPKYSPENGEVTRIEYTETKKWKTFSYGIRVNENIRGYEYDITLNDDYLYSTKTEAEKDAQEIYFSKVK